MKYEFAPVPRAVMTSTALKPNAKIVLAALLKRAGKNGHCWPSQNTLADDCGMTRNQVRYALDQLTAQRWIRIAPTSMGGSNGYTFNETTICGVGESYHQGLVNSPGLVNGSPLKETIKEGPGGTRLVVVEKIPPRPDHDECPYCHDTGFREVEVKGVQCVTRCTHAGSG